MPKQMTGEVAAATVEVDFAGRLRWRTILKGFQHPCNPEGEWRLHK